MAAAALKDTAVVYMDFDNVASNTTHSTGEWLPPFMDTLRAQYKLCKVVAYGEWSHAPEEMETLREMGIETVNVMSFTQGGKNGGDILMAVHATLYALQEGAAVPNFIFLTGDSDFYPLIVAVKQMARRVTVVSWESCMSARLIGVADCVTLLDDFMGQQHFTSLDRRNYSSVMHRAIKAVQLLNNERGDNDSAPCCANADVLRTVRALDASFSFTRFGMSWRGMCKAIKDGCPAILHGNWAHDDFTLGVIPHAPMHTDEELEHTKNVKTLLSTFAVAGHSALWQHFSDLPEASNMMSALPIFVRVLCATLAVRGSAAGVTPPSLRTMSKNVGGACSQIGWEQPLTLDEAGVTQGEASLMKRGLAAVSTRVHNALASMVLYVLGEDGVDVGGMNYVKQRVRPVRDIPVRPGMVAAHFWRGFTAALQHPVPNNLEGLDLDALRCDVVGYVVLDQSLPSPTAPQERHQFAATTACSPPAHSRTTARGTEARLTDMALCGLKYAASNESLSASHIRRFGVAASSLPLVLKALCAVMLMFRRKGTLMTLPVLRTNLMSIDKTYVDDQARYGLAPTHEDVLLTHEEALALSGVWDAVEKSTVNALVLIVVHNMCDNTHNSAMGDQTLVQNRVYTLTSAEEVNVEELQGAVVSALCGWVGEGHSDAVRQLLSTGLANVE
jgi:hypothetical protein